MPLVPGPGATPTQLGGVDRSGLGAPAPDRLLGHHHAAGQRHLLDLAEAQREPEGQPDTVVDDLDRVGGGPCRRGLHLSPPDHPSTPVAVFNVTMPSQ